MQGQVIQGGQAPGARFAEEYLAGPDGRHVRRHLGLGEPGVQLVEVGQPAGHYETPGTSDIVLG